MPVDNCEILKNNKYNLPNKRELLNRDGNPHGGDKR